MESHGLSMLGDIDGLTLKPETDFPPTPRPGRVAFVNKRAWLCVEIENGVPAYIPLSQEIAYYRHNQEVPALDWQVSHNLNMARPIVQVYDQNGEMTSPAKVKAVDVNTIQLSFSMPVIGTAVCMTGSAFGLPAPSYAYESPFTNQQDFTINHNLGYAPRVSVWVIDNGAMTLVTPVITHLDNNSTRIQLARVSSGVVYFN